MQLEREAIYWHFPHYSNHGMQSPGGAVRAGDYKLLEYFENNTVQLFNLRDDIGEQNDLSQVEPDKVARLRAMLHAWRKDGIGADDGTQSRIRSHGSTIRHEQLSSDLPLGR